jgi:hypothetical protein
VKLTLGEMARQMRAARVGPDSDQLRGLAGKALIAAGRPVATLRQVQALLDCVRSRTVYMPDPVSAEYVVAAAGTLCVRPGLCVPAGDCDDLTVALGALCLVSGIPVRIIKQTYGMGDQEHVLIEAYDGDTDTWIPADPSGNQPAGWKSPASSEVRIDPMDDAQIGMLADTESNFVGVGRLGVGSSWLTVVTAGSVQELKDRLNGYALGLDAIISTCTTVAVDTKAAWAPWLAQWKAYYDNPPPWYAGAAYQDEAESWQKDIQNWQSLVASQSCQGVPSPSTWNADTSAVSQIPSAIKSIAIGAVVVAAAAVAWKVIDYAQKSPPKKPEARKSNPLPRTTRVQTLLFPKDAFTLESAAKWAHRHGYGTDYGLDITRDYIRVRQYPPSSFQKGSFRTISLGQSGVRAIVGRPR